MRCALIRAAALCASLLPAGPVAAQHAWHPDERAVLSDFTQVVGVAVDPWRVFAATANGIISYDPLQRRWELPLTEEDGYPVHERPTAFAAVDHGSTLLLGTWVGTVWRVDVEARRVERLTTLPGAVTTIRGDDAGNAYLRTALGWFLLAPGSFMAEPVAGAPAASGSDDPYLRAMLGQLELDPDLRRRPITSLVPGRTDGEYFIGTDGGGMARADTRSQEVEWLFYGAPTTGAGAVGSALGRVWLGGDGTARRRAGVTAASPDLQEWTSPPERDAPRGAVHAIVEHERAAWIAADDGLFRVDARGRWQRFTTRQGLPVERATALLADSARLWVGTARGVCLMQDDACAGNLLPGRHVQALAACDGRVWIGSRNGLYAAVGADVVAIDEARLRGPIRALACSETRLHVATERALLEYDAGGWHEPALSPLGRLYALAVSDGQLWIGGEGGLGQRNAATGQWSYYIVPSDIPQGPVHGILAFQSALWLATPGGIIRLELQPH